MSSGSNRGYSPRYDDFEHPVKADSDVCHNEGQSETSKPTISPRMMELAGELAVLLSVDDVLYVDDPAGRKRADWLGNELGRELQLMWPEFHGERWGEPNCERHRPAWNRGERAE